MSNETEVIELLFTREGMTERMKVQGAFSEEVRETFFSYHAITQQEIKFRIVKINPQREDGYLTGLIFHVTDYSRNPQPSDTGNDITQPQDRSQLDTENEIQKTGIKIKGEFIKCRFQYEILVNTANWLIDKGCLTDEDVPIEAAGNPWARPYLINSIQEGDEAPRQSNGEYFSTPKELINGLWIETRYALPLTKKHAKHLMKLCGYSESDLEDIGFKIQPRPGSRGG